MLPTRGDGENPWATPDAAQAQQQQQAPRPTPQAAPDPWLQAQQQAQDAAYARWGALNTPQASVYQVDPGQTPTQNPGGGYNSGEDWVAAQAKAQADSDRRYGPAQGVNWKGQTGPYGETSDLPMAPNYLVARADQWAMNGSGPAIAPAMQGAVNEDPRLAGLYSNLPVARLNNVGNGYGALPGALTPSAMFGNGGQMPQSYNDLLKYSQTNPGAPQGMQNLGPAVAARMAANPLRPPPTYAGGDPSRASPGGNETSYYDYSSPNASGANSPAAQRLAQGGGMMPQQGQQNAMAQFLAQLGLGGATAQSGGQRAQVPIGGGLGSQSPFGMAPQTGGSSGGGIPPQLMAAMAQQPGGGYSYMPTQQPQNPFGGASPISGGYGQGGGTGGNQQQILAALLGGSQRSAGTPPPPVRQSPQQMGANPLLQRSNTGLLALGGQ